jgi:hypothetical protein
MRVEEAEREVERRILELDTTAEDDSAQLANARAISGM